MNGAPAATPASLHATATEQPDKQERRKKSTTPQLQSQPAAVAQAKRSAGSLEAREPSQEQNGLPTSDGTPPPLSYLRSLAYTLINLEP